MLNPTNKFVLTSDQVNALKQLHLFMNSKTANIYILGGYAGTGKTTVLRSLVNDYGYSSFYFTAPTNKATNILQRTLCDNRAKCSTIYSLLNINMVQKEDKLALSYPSEIAEVYRTIVIDEVSMLSSVLIQYLLRVAEHNKIKLIFIGDSAQLPPIGEPSSPIFNIQSDYHYTLTEVVRYNDDMLEMATHIRECISESKKIVIPYTDSENIKVRKYDEFITDLLKSITDGQFTSDSKVIAWRNKTVDEYNQLIRKNLFSNPKCKFVVGERIAMASPVFRNKEVIATIDDECTITKVRIGHETKFNIKIYRLHVRFDNGMSCKLNIVHELEQSIYERRLSGLAQKAKQSNNWKSYWELKQYFHTVRYSYAITAHRSQGSTYKQTFVDVTDILYNSNVKEAMHCLYVANTRQTDNLTIRI